jgi:hypothetical protein
MLRKKLENMTKEFDNKCLSECKSIDVKFNECGHVKQCKIISLIKKLPVCTECKSLKRNKLIKSKLNASTANISFH